MNFSELVRKRYSVRSYTSQPVTDEGLRVVLQDACLAPTAANRQAFQLIVFRTDGRMGGRRNSSVSTIRMVRPGPDHNRHLWAEGRTVVRLDQASNHYRILRQDQKVKSMGSRHLP